MNDFCRTEVYVKQCERRNEEKRINYNLRRDSGGPAEDAALGVASVEARVVVRNAERSDADCFFLAVRNRQLAS